MRLHYTIILNILCTVYLLYRRDGGRYNRRQIQENYGMSDILYYYPSAYISIHVRLIPLPH